MNKLAESLLNGTPEPETVESLVAKVTELAKGAGVEYIAEPGEGDGYISLRADYTNDFEPVRAALEQAFGEVQELNHVAECGDDGDEDIDDDDSFEGFKVGGIIVQFEHGNEEFIQIYPSANP